MRTYRHERVRQAIVDAALTLMVDRPFAAVSVDSIAAAAGIGRRTFFRYFPTKEDLVLDPRRLDREYAVDALSHRGPGEDDIALVMRVMTELQRRAFAHIRPEHQAVLHRLSHAEPEIMARSWLLLEQARELIVDGLVGPRATGSERLRARVVVGACLMAVDAAISSWQDEGSGEPLAAVLSRAEEDLRRGVGGGVASARARRG